MTVLQRPVGGRRRDGCGARAAGDGCGVPRAAAGRRQHRGAHRTRRSQACRAQRTAEEGI